MPRGKPENHIRTLERGYYTFTTVNRKETRARLKAGWKIKFGPSLGKYKTKDRRFKRRKKK